MQDEKRCQKATLRLVKDDITLLEQEAFVFYARNDLILGSGIGNAITVRGGPTIQEDLKPLAPIETTQVVISDAGNLKARKILHAAGPKFQEPDLENKLRTTIRNCLQTAEDIGLTSLTFPAMGAGFYGIPLNDCAAIMMGTIQAYLSNGARLDSVTVCLNDNREMDAFRKILNA